MNTPIVVIRFLRIRPIKLPVEAWAPGVRDYVQADLLAQAKSKVESARRDLESAKRKVSDSTSLTLPEQEGKTWSDDFKRAKPNLWQTIGRGWRYQGGLLAQTQPTMERSCLRSKRNHPRDFELNLRFRTTGGNQWKSTGIRFDADTTGENAHTVYVSAFEGGPKVQLSHTVAGQNIYPGDGPCRTKVKLFA